MAVTRAVGHEYRGPLDDLTLGRGCEMSVA